MIQSGVISLSTSATTYAVVFPISVPVDSITVIDDSILNTNNPSDHTISITSRTNQSNTGYTAVFNTIPGTGYQLVWKAISVIPSEENIPLQALGYTNTFQDGDAYLKYGPNGLQLIKAADYETRYIFNGNSVPSGKYASGTLGQVAFDNSYFYCYMGSYWNRFAKDGSFT